MFIDQQPAGRSRHRRGDAGAPWLLLFLVVLSGCSRPADPSASKPAPPAAVAHARPEAELSTVTLSPEAIKRLGIEATVASIQAVSETRVVGGEVIVPEGRAVVVSAPVAGTLGAVGAAAGTQVKKGQVLFTLLPLAAAERDQRIEAQRGVSAAEAETTAAGQRLARLEGLLKEGAASVRAVEEARSHYEVAAAALVAARARLASTAAGPHGAGGALRIETPIDGVVQSIAAAAGQTVAAGAPLFEVAQLDLLWVRVPVYAGDLDTFDSALAATMTSLGSSGAPWTLRPATAPRKADAAAASVDLVYQVTGGAASLRPGQRVAVHLPTRAASEGLTIPDSAILYDMHGATWVYEDAGSGRFLRRRIEVARNVAGRVQIARGLSPGTRVVTTGAAEIFGTEFAAGK